MIFPKRLKDLREEKGYTRTYVAQQCDVSIQCISSLEAGTRSPTGSTLVALATFFDVSIDYLMGQEDNDNFIFSHDLEQPKEKKELGVRGQKMCILAQKLKELRTERNLRQKDVAQAIGVLPQSYGFYENGINKPDPDTLIKLADFFGCSVDYLLGRTDDLGNSVATDMELPADEQELLANFRTLPREEKVQARSYVRYLADRRTDFTKKA